jgi:hypothetical protein
MIGTEPSETYIKEWEYESLADMQERRPMRRLLQTPPPRSG